MSFVQYSKSMVFPYKTLTDQFGNSQTIDLGSYTSGYYSVGKAESVKREKPKDMKALSSLTSFGLNTEDVIDYGSFDATFNVAGYKVDMHDLNAQDYFAVGRTISAEDPDWEGKLRLAVKDQAVNLAQSMAEYKQTQRMFVENATGLIKLLRKLKREGKVPFTEDAKRIWQLKVLRIPLPVKVAKPTKLELRSRITNRYLEYQFGVRPLIQDLYGAASELENNLSRPHYRSVSISASNEVRNERVGILSLDGRRVTATDTDRVTIKAKAIVLGESLSAQRLGFTNPAALFWELLPYSFVVDYFIGVGNWLNGLDAMVGIQQCYGTVTRKNKYISTSSLGGYYFSRSYGRSVFETLPGSRPTPMWKPSLGFTRVTNILALLSQLKR